MRTRRNSGTRDTGTGRKKDEVHNKRKKKRKCGKSEWRNEKRIRKRRKEERGRRKERKKEKDRKKELRLHLLFRIARSGGNHRSREDRPIVVMRTSGSSKSNLPSDSYH